MITLSTVASGKKRKEKKSARDFNFLFLKLGPVRRSISLAMLFALLFAAQLLFRLVSAACERRALGVASHWPFDQWGRFLPEHTTAVSLLDRLLHHAHVVVTCGTQSCS